MIEIKVEIKKDNNQEIKENIALNITGGINKVRDRKIEKGKIRDRNKIRVKIIGKKAIMKDNRFVIMMVINTLIEGTNTNIDRDIETKSIHKKVTIAETTEINKVRDIKETIEITVRKGNTMTVEIIGTNPVAIEMMTEDHLIIRIRKRKINMNIINLKR